MDDRAAFRTAAAICVVLCLIWDLATVVLPLQLAAIGLLYWAPRGWSVRRTNRGRRFRKR